ncbi:MAG: hypothetical protein Q9227_002427 [Pyrenula ochraceoflavens]
MLVVKGTNLAAGATLTIHPREGTLLVAFLALFVRMAGSQLWSLICFALHQVRSSRVPQDGLHHQQQVLLRNSASQNRTLLELLRTSWSWRRNAKRALPRCLPLILLAVAHSAAFALAGLFSSRVATVLDEVLVRSEYCGYFKFPNQDLPDLEGASFDLANAATVNSRAISIWSSNYARECYVDQITPGCNIFARQQLLSSMDRSAKCPFAEKVCMDDQNGVVRLDSGPIYSDIHLGINTPRRDAVVYRTALTCAPIWATPFTSDIVGASGKDLPGDRFLYYYFGEQVNDTSSFANYTYEYDDYAARTNLLPYKL